MPLHRTDKYCCFGRDINVLTRIVRCINKRSQAFPFQHFVTISRKLFIILFNVSADGPNIYIEKTCCHLTCNKYFAFPQNPFHTGFDLYFLNSNLIIQNILAIKSRCCQIFSQLCCLPTNIGYHICFIRSCFSSSTLYTPSALLCSIIWQLGQTGTSSLTGSTTYSSPISLIGLM